MRRILKNNNQDVQTSTRLLQEDLGRTFGETRFNGIKEYTLFPIEKMGNLPPNSVPLMQQDFRDQMAPKLLETKKLFDNNKVDFYWEVNPVVDLE